MPARERTTPRPRPTTRPAGERFERSPPPATVISMAGIPLQQAPCLPPGSVHVAVTGTAMHWIADSGGFASTGSVFPGYPDHVDEAERLAWRVAAERQWQRLLELRAVELAPGGRFIAALPASPEPCPEQDGALRRDHRRHEPDARRLAPRGAHRRGHRRRDRRAGVDAHARRDPRAVRGGRRSRRRPRARERRALPTRQPLLGRRSRRVRPRATSAACSPGAGRCCSGAFAREGEDRVPGLLADFLRTLEERVADDPDRYRWDYVEALVVCRKAERARARRRRSARGVDAEDGLDLVADVVAVDLQRDRAAVGRARR